MAFRRPIGGTPQAEGGAGHRFGFPISDCGRRGPTGAAAGQFGPGQGEFRGLPLAQLQATPIELKGHLRLAFVILPVGPQVEGPLAFLPRRPGAAAQVFLRQPMGIESHQGIREAPFPIGFPGPAKVPQGLLKLALPTAGPKEQQGRVGRVGNVRQSPLQQGGRPRRIALLEGLPGRPVVLRWGRRQRPRQGQPPPPKEP